MLSQSFHRYEVIVVNDRSTDLSGVIADMCSHKDTRAKLFRHPRNKVNLIAGKPAFAHAHNQDCLFLDGQSN